jgi:predicted ATPase
MAKKEIKKSKGGLKLIAIRPLNDCDLKFRKNLNEGVVYKFYQDYKFLDKNENEILSENKNLNKSIKKITPPNKQIDLFTKDDITVNVSVIIGENGSGKSTLVELLCVFSFLIFKKYSITYKETLKKLKRERNELIKFCDLSLEKIRKNENLDFKEFSQSHLRRFYQTEEKILYLSNESLLEKEFSDFNCEFYFEKNSDIVKVEILNGDFKLFNLKDEEWQFNDIPTFHGVKSGLFYSILLNYSIYSFRKSVHGKWIELLYHKNDAYKTPLVINPMKTDGNIEVNNEIHLQLQRIFNSILSSKKVLNKEISEIWFTLREKNDEFNYIVNFDDFSIKREQKNDLNESSNFLFVISGKTKSINELNLSDIKGLNISEKRSNHVLSEVEIVILKYIIRKLVKYYLLYMYSNDMKENFTTIKNFNSIFSKINANNSFKEKKLNSAKWLLTWKVLNSKFIKNKKEEYVLKFDSYSEFISLASKHNFLESNPLSFMKMDFLFNDGSTLGDMSSGQLQLLNSLNTISYHLRNLDSDIHSYKYVNIVLDEVELYLHPEFQRQYVNTILSGIREIGLSNIKGINLLLLTHSPFVLSDIPSSNVLHLKEGAPTERSANTNTFGANIYDLFNDSFFMKDGFIGQFAQEKIDKVFKDLNNALKKKKEVGADTEFDLGIEEDRKAEIEQIISVIGEPLIKRQLSKIFDKLYQTDLEVNAIDEQIKRLKKIRDNRYENKRK